MQCPLYDTTPYIPKEDLHLKCGLTIPKGTQFSFALHIMSNKPEQWKSPEEFIPERFDPTHEMSKTPTGEKRHHLSYAPFSFGARACPARSLGMLELKVFTVFFMKFMEWDISKEQLEDENLHFAFLSQHKLEVDVKEA